MTLLESVTKQLAEEVGDDENFNRDTFKILQMKYGMIATTLTSSEKYLIQKEERLNGQIESNTPVR